MNDLIATLNHIRGETITFGLRALDPPYDGTETVTCAVKKARNGVQVPPVSDPIVLIASVDFVAGSDDTPPAWVFGLMTAYSIRRAVAGNKILHTNSANGDWLRHRSHDHS